MFKSPMLMSTDSGSSISISISGAAGSINSSKPCGAAYKPLSIAILIP